MNKKVTIKMLLIVVNGYRVSSRSHTPPDNAIFHVGFRGVKDI